MAFPLAAVIGLDHVPVAVRDLDAAVATYRALGFTLKPGRDHANGIRNAHVKFPDGSGIELLTAPKGVDALSRRYVELLRAGEGPAFVSFHARDKDVAGPDLDFVFVVRDNRSPTDEPAHFDHANGAVAMRAVWVATEHGETLARFLVEHGGRRQRRTVLAPEPVEATVVTLGEGEVVILPKSHQVLPGRPVIGASFRVRDPGAGSSKRVVVAPAEAHGLWLEFRAQ